MIYLDSLVHTTPDSKWFHTSYDASETRLLREMDIAHIDKAILVGLAEHISNNYILEATNRHKDRLLPCGSFNPAGYASAYEAITACRKELQNSPFVAVKFHPRLNHYDPLDDRMLGVLTDISSWDNPPKIWLDTLFHKRGIILKKNPVESIHALINTFPSLTFMLLHGAGRTILQLAEAIRDCHNAYIDISFTLNRYQGTSLIPDLQHLISIFDQRIVFGSDFPEVSILEARAQTEVLLSGLPQAKIEAVFGGNLARIFALQN